MGVFASGRLVVNPDFAARLNDRELVFVLAHEMLHLALRTHDRAREVGRGDPARDAPQGKRDGLPHPGLGRRRGHGAGTFPGTG
jgi:hypothetical protein